MAGWEVCYYARSHSSLLRTCRTESHDAHKVDCVLEIARIATSAKRVVPRPVGRSPTKTTRSAFPCNAIADGASSLALTGKMDDHFTALWDHGHIKFWSKRTLSMLLEETGFVSVRFELTGRIRPLAKSMIAIARKP